jgi:hypothetical protein
MVPPMARTQRDVTLPVSPPDAYALARNSGCVIPSFRMQGEDPVHFRIFFHRGFGWSNPIDVTVTIWQSGPQQSTLRYEASILALADPFKFMDKNLERFQLHLEAHYHAWMNNAPPPPPPVDTHSVKVNMGIIGCMVAGVVVLLAIVLAAALVR